MAIPSGVIVMWPSTAASIPSGWTRVTDLDARFPKGTAASTNPNVTGGVATHTHTSPGHTHTIASHTHAGTTGGPSGATQQLNLANPGVADNTHTHSFTSGSVAATAESTTATWQTANSEPSFFNMIFVQSNGAPLGIPDGVCVFYNASSAPSGWIQHVGSKDRFLKGAAAAGDGGSTGGGAHTHTADSHSHTISNHTHGAATSGGAPNHLGEGGAENWAKAGHTHTVSFTAAPSAGAGSTTSADTASTDYKPSFHTLLCIENDVGREHLPAEIICMWLGTLANIPVDWRLCDGTNGTPDLRDRFIKAANIGGDVGTTGGSNGHDHTDPAGHTHTASHSHTISTDGPSTTIGIWGSGSNPPVSSNSHTHGGNTNATDPGTDSIAQTVDANADTQPPFRTVAYIQLFRLSPKQLFVY